MDSTIEFNDIQPADFVRHKNMAAVVLDALALPYWGATTTRARCNDALALPEVPIARENKPGARAAVIVIFFMLSPFELNFLSARLPRAKLCKLLQCRSSEPGHIRSWWKLTLTALPSVLPRAQPTDFTRCVSQDRRRAVAHGCAKGG
jgi:hypothetical protein